MADAIGFAQWLVRPENPLTARAVMNRLWKQFYGIGLVKTLEDLGTQGEVPPNQPLLGRTSGNTSRGMCSARRSSSSHSRVSRFINCVRLALVQSVRCSPPVRFHNTNVSMLPNRRSPASARAGPSCPNA